MTVAGHGTGVHRFLSGGPGVPPPQLFPNAATVRETVTKVARVPACMSGLNTEPSRSSPEPPPASSRTREPSGSVDFSGSCWPPPDREQRATSLQNREMWRSSVQCSRRASFSRRPDHHRPMTRRRQDSTSAADGVRRGTLRLNPPPRRRPQCRRPRPSGWPSSIRAISSAVTARPPDFFAASFGMVTCGASAISLSFAAQFSAAFRVRRIDAIDASGETVLVAEGRRTSGTARQP